MGKDVGNNSVLYIFKRSDDNFRYGFCRDVVVITLNPTLAAKAVEFETLSRSLLCSVSSCHVLDEYHVSRDGWTVQAGGFLYVDFPEIFYYHLKC